MNSWWRWRCMQRPITRAVEHVERGEQGGRAVALVVVGHGAGPALLERQARLGAVERLDLMGWMAPSRHRRAKLVAVEQHQGGAIHMEITTIGLDLAKQVFQVHGVDEAGHVVVQAPPPARSGHHLLRLAAILPDRHGSLRHRALLGARAALAGTRGAPDAAAVRQGLRQAGQERRGRRRGDLRGRDAAVHALRAGQDRRAAVGIDACTGRASCWSGSEPS